MGQAVQKAFSTALRKQFDLQTGSVIQTRLIQMIQSGRIFREEVRSAVLEPESFKRLDSYLLMPSGCTTRAPA